MVTQTFFAFLKPSEVQLYRWQWGLIWWIWTRIVGSSIHRGACIGHWDISALSRFLVLWCHSTGIYGHYVCKSIIFEPQPEYWLDFAPNVFQYVLVFFWQALCDKIINSVFDFLVSMSLCELALKCVHLNMSALTFSWAGAALWNIRSPNSAAIDSSVSILLPSFCKASLTSINRSLFSMPAFSIPLLLQSKDSSFCLCNKATGISSIGIFHKTFCSNRIDAYRFLKVSSKLALCACYSYLSRTAPIRVTRVLCSFCGVWCFD